MPGRRGLVLLLPLALLSCAARFAPPIDGARAHDRVVKQVAFGPRVPGTPGHEAMRAWLVGELKHLGADVEEQSFSDSSLGRKLSLANVIGRYSPASGSVTRRVVLCAHWDSRPWSDEDPDTASRRVPCPGANDGGSGVAVLLEVAECLAKQQAPIGVDLVFFDAEDMGRSTHPEEFSIGAREYAHRLPPNGDPGRPVAAFLFDMVGDKDLNIPVESYSSQRASNLIAMVLDGARATGASHFHDEIRYTIVDDHLPLLDAGLPAVDLIDFDYPAWHTHLDLPDQVSPASLAEVSTLAAWLVYRSPLAKS
jgi:Zn-dependent M28 family amino/carboxypeptidase